MSASATVPEGYKQTEIGVFPNDWQIKKFGDIFDFKSTASNSRSDLTETDEAHYIHYGDIHTIFHRHLDLSKKSTPRIDFSLCKNASQIRNGDWVMADASEDFSGICKAIEISGIDEDKSVVAGLHTFLLRDRNEEYSPGFKGHLGEAKFLHDQYVRVSVGLKVFGVTKTSLRDLLIPVPPKHQQIKVEEILTQADAQIQSFEHLIAKKRDIKQGAMQGLLTGKTRLAGFSDEWVVRRLGDFAVIIMGQSPSSSSYNTSGIGLPLIQGNADVENRMTIIRNYTSQITKEAKKGDIIMSVRAPVGEIASTNFDACIGRGVCAIKYPNNYLFHLLIFSESIWTKFSGGSTFESINSNEIQNATFLIPPTKNEQVAIASILSDMDAEITALEERLEKAKAIKQGMMQQLLTGKIRLVD